MVLALTVDYSKSKGGVKHTKEFFDSLSDFEYVTEADFIGPKTQVKVTVTVGKQSLPPMLIGPYGDYYPDDVTQYKPGPDFIYTLANKYGFRLPISTADFPDINTYVHKNYTSTVALNADIQLYQDALDKWSAGMDAKTTNTFDFGRAKDDFGTFTSNQPLSVNEVVAMKGTILDGNDIITGSNFADTLNGEKGDDTIKGGGGNDIIDGGIGIDTVIVDGNFTPDKWTPIGKQNFTVHTNLGKFGDYQFKFISDVTDGGGNPGVKVNIIGPASEGTDTVQNVEYFGKGTETAVPLEHYEFYINKDGKGHGSIDLWEDGKPTLLATSNFAYDDSLVCLNGDYDVILRTNAHLGKVFELASYTGMSWFQDRYAIQLHIGNTPGDSVGCFVATGTFLNSAIANIETGIEATNQNEVTIDTPQPITSRSFYIIQDNNDKDKAKLTPAVGVVSPTLNFRNYIKGYMPLIPITIHVSGINNQPTLSLSSTHIVKEGQSTSLTAEIGGLLQGFLMDRDVIARIKVASGYGVNYVMGGASAYLDANFLPTTVDKNVRFIDACIQGNTADVHAIHNSIPLQKGTSSANMSFNALADTTIEQPKTFHFELIGYQTTRHATNGGVETSTPPGQTMLPEGMAGRTVDITVYDQQQQGSATVNSQGGMDYVALSGSAASALVGTVKFDQITVLGDGNVKLSAAIENVQLSGAHAANILGNSLANVITGNDGGDSINAGAGNDTVLCGTGNDTVFAQLNDGNDSYDGGLGINTLSYAGLLKTVKVDLSQGTSTGAECGTDSVVNFQNIIGGSGNDQLTGNYEANRIDGGAGNDTLTGGGGYDTYVFGPSFGKDVINNAVSDGTAANGQVSFGAGITDKNLWFAKSGTNLLVTLVGTSNNITLSNWYGSNPSAQVTGFHTSDGLKIDTQVAQLVSAMASYSNTHAGFNPSTATQMPTDTTLQLAIAATWHS